MFPAATVASCALMFSRYLPSQVQHQSNQAAESPCTLPFAL